MIEMDGISGENKEQSRNSTTFISLRNNLAEKWSDLKTLLNIENAEDQVYETDDDEETQKLNKKQTALVLGNSYIADKTKVPEDALLFYISKLSKGEKIDFIFISQLLKKGIKVNECDEIGENAIFKAVRVEHDTLISVLLEAKIDKMKINSYGCNIFHITARNSSSVITRLIAATFQKHLLAKYIDMRTNDEEQTPLHYACKKGTVSVAECFISEYGADREILDYRLRSPLYLAAEIGHQSMVKALMRLNCKVCYSDDDKTKTLNNINGQSALYWIVTKMPDIAKEALNELHETNSYLRKEKHYISALEPAMPLNKNSQYISMSVLDGIIEKDNYDLIEHPTIRCLVDYKWRKLAWWNAWIDVFFTILNISIWILAAIAFPLNKHDTYLTTSLFNRENITTDAYNGTQRNQFFVLLTFGILCTLYLIFLEMKEVFYEYRFQKIHNDFRAKELEDYKERAKEKDVNISFYADELLQIKQNNLFKILVEYITDIWNIYDWIVVGLLIGCVYAYVNATANNNTSSIMFLTVLFIPLRLLKTSRILIPKLGTLVLTLYYTVSHIIVWMGVFSVIWLSFSLTLWLIYGNSKYDLASSANDKCTDIKNETANALYNCTVVVVPELETFSMSAYSLFRQIFGTDLDEARMNLVNNELTKPLIATYVGLTVLVLANIFIAMLSAEFTKIHDKADAFITFQRAKEISNIEKALSFSEKKTLNKKIRKLGNPYTVRLEREILSYADDMLASLENELTEQRRMLVNMEKSMEYSNMVFKHHSSKTIISLEKIEMQNEKLEDIIEREVKIETIFTKFVRDYKKEKDPYTDSAQPEQSQPEDATLDPSKPVVPWKY